MRIRETPERAEFSDWSVTTEPDAEGTTQTFVSGRLYPNRNNQGGFFGAWINYTRHDADTDQEQVTARVVLDSSTLYTRQRGQEWPEAISIPGGTVVEMQIIPTASQFEIEEAEAATIALYRLALIQSQENRRNTP